MIVKFNSQNFSMTSEEFTITYLEWHEILVFIVFQVEPLSSLFIVSGSKMTTSWFAN